MILVIVGPTGVGKTKLSIELAKIYNGEIINADSMQVYKGLDVGTAKATLEERQNIKHHLLDIKEVWENYTVFDYQKDAREKIEEIKAKGKIPILVGGTGYYIKAALYDYDFLEENNQSNKYANLTIEKLNELLSKYELSINIDKNNKKRLIRLLEKLETGWEPEKKDYKLIYDDVYFIGLTTSRDKLYDIIDKRFEKMIIPLIDEVKPYFLKQIDSKALKTGIGYKELWPFFENKKTLVEVVKECQKNSRNYAKRQYTWFNNQMDINWFNVDYVNFNNTVKEVVEFIDNK